MDSQTKTADHGALMDAVYRHTRHVYDASRKFFLFGRDALIAELNPAPGQYVCEAGCGTARNLIKMAQRYPQARFCGYDASQAMLETARASLKRAGLDKRVALAHGFAESFEPRAAFGLDPDQSIDRFVFSFSLTMIPPWREALEHAFAMLRPGGAIHIVDFGPMERWPAVVRAPFMGFLGAFHVQPQRAIFDWGRAQAAGGAAVVRERPILKGYAIVMTITKR